MENFDDVLRIGDTKFVDVQSVTITVQSDYIIFCVADRRVVIIGLSTEWESESWC